MPKKTKTDEKPKIGFKTYKFKVMPTEDASHDSVLSVAAAKKSSVDINKICQVCGTRVEKNRLTGCSCCGEKVCNGCIKGGKKEQTCSICQGGKK